MYKVPLQTGDTLSSATSQPAASPWTNQLELLYPAVRSNNLQVVKILIAQNADIDARCPSRECPVHVAVNMVVAYVAQLNLPCGREKGELVVGAGCLRARQVWGQGYR